MTYGIDLSENRGYTGEFGAPAGLDLDKRLEQPKPQGSREYLQRIRILKYKKTLRQTRR